MGSARIRRKAMPARSTYFIGAASLSSDGRDLVAEISRDLGAEAVSLIYREGDVGQPACMVPMPGFHDRSAVTAATIALCQPAVTMLVCPPEVCMRPRAA